MNKKISIDDIKKLRQETAAPVMDCKKALEQSDGKMVEAVKLLKKWGMVKADKKAGRETTQGVIFSYVHHGGRVASMIELACETDFVARTDEFNRLAREIAMQVASMSPKDVDDLLKQVYIRDSKMTVEDLVKNVAAKVGENVVVKRFVRYEVGE